MADPESFISNYMGWGDKRIAGRRASLDRSLSANRGMDIEAQLHDSVATFKARSAKPTNNPAVRAKATRDLGMAKILMAHPDVKNRPTAINDIASRYHDMLGQATGRAIDHSTAIPGTAWYFDHRRQQAEHVDPGANLTGRQTAAIGGKLSSTKTPEDETASLSGITALAGSQRNRKINGRRISGIPSEELAGHAAAASAWSAHRDYVRSGRQTSVPTVGDPQAHPEVYEHLRMAGRAHESNVHTALQVARSEITPKEAYGETTPKTSAYAEMQAQSDPGSLVETDYRNISAHYRDVQAGTQSKGQGMMLFSQQEGADRPHALSPDAPTAIDTWMVAAGSGQPMQAKHPETGKTYSPAKRLVDKDFPLEPGAQTKTSHGLLGTDASVTSNAAVSAQHNEAIRRLSRNTIGAVSHDQFGGDVHLPSSLIQETVWTEARRQAGWDPAFNASERETAKAASASTKVTARAAKEHARNNPTLF